MACPVDAIMGASKQMHTVINNECTGCELCIEPCPVDCIDMIEIKPFENKKQRADQYRERYRAHNERIAKEKLVLAEKHQANLQKLTENKKAAKLAEIKAALARVRTRNKDKK